MRSSRARSSSSWPTRTGGPEGQLIRRGFRRFRGSASHRDRSRSQAPCHTGAWPRQPSILRGRACLIGSNLGPWPAARAGPSTANSRWLSSAWIQAESQEVGREDSALRTRLRIVLRTYSGQQAVESGNSLVGSPGGEPGSPHGDRTGCCGSVTVAEIARRPRCSTGALVEVGGLGPRWFGSRFGRGGRSRRVGGGGG